MTATLDIAHRRLHNQHLAGTSLEKPEDVVRWLCAVQAQDYPAAQWALGLRLRDAKVDAVEQAFTSGAILRTHVMRPTWHFVTPDDIRWLLAVTGPRVHALNAYQYRRLELDGALLGRCNALLQEALQGRKQLTRAELGAMLQQGGIDTHDGQRLGYIMMHAELERIVCSGARRGKQFTYALLEERAPSARTLERDEALAELAGRYFTGHGPATIKDFVWWSGLTTADARAGVEMARHRLVSEVVNGQTYWLAEPAPFVREPSPTAYLLPNYDEYGIGYADRSAYASRAQWITSDAAANLTHLIVIDGQIVGGWRRIFSKGTAVITPELFSTLSSAERQALTAAANRYSDFLGMPVTLT